MLMWQYYYSGKCVCLGRYIHRCTAFLSYIIFVARPILVFNPRLAQNIQNTHKCWGEHKKLKNILITYTLNIYNDCYYYQLYI